MKTILAPVFLLLQSTILFAQAPSIEWTGCFGGTGDEYGRSVVQTADGGYLICGGSNSSDGDITTTHGGGEFWIVRLDSSGSLQWEKSYGGSASEHARMVSETNDGGYIIAGSTTSDDGDVTGNHNPGLGTEDYWIVKIDGAGTIQWQKTLGGSNNDYAYAVRQTGDNGYIVAGYVTSNDSDVTGNHGGSDYWIVKLDSTGIIQWQKCYGGSGAENAFDVNLTSDSGFIVAGLSGSNDGDVTGNHGNTDYWIVKLDSTGNLQWQQSFGGTDSEIAQSISLRDESSYVISGTARSNDGDVTGNHGAHDFWLIQLDLAGNLLWQKCLGGSDDDNCRSMDMTNEGGFVLAGVTESNDGDVSGNNGLEDFWIVKTDSAGNIGWQKCAGGSATQDGQSVKQTSNGEYIVGGWSESNDTSVCNLHGYWGDYWIVKLGPGSVAFAEEENNRNELNAYFSSHTLHMNIFTRQQETHQLTLFDITGRSILTKDISTTSGINKIDIETGVLAKGIYFISLLGEKNRTIVKTMKE